MTFSEFLKCKICHNFAEHPIVLRCQHMYCAICIEKHKMSSLECPFCRSSFETQSLDRDTYLDTIIRKYKEELGLKDELNGENSFSSTTTQSSEPTSEEFSASASYSSTTEQFQASVNEVMQPREESASTFSESSEDNDERLLPKPALSPAEKRLFLGESYFQAEARSIKHEMPQIEFSSTSDDVKENPLLEFALEPPEPIEVAVKKSQDKADTGTASQVFKRLAEPLEISLTSETTEECVIEQENDIFGKPALKCNICNMFIKTQHYQVHELACAPGKFSVIGKARMRLETPQIKKRPKYVYSDNMGDKQIRDQLILMGFTNKHLAAKSINELRSLLKRACKTYEDLNNDAEFFKNEEAILQMACEEAVIGEDLYIELLLELVATSDKSVRFTIQRILRKKADENHLVVIN